MRSTLFSYLLRREQSPKRLRLAELCRRSTRLFGWSDTAKAKPFRSPRGECLHHVGARDHAEFAVTAAALSGSPRFMIATYRPFGLYGHPNASIFAGGD